MECTPTQHPSPITRPAASRQAVLLHASSPFPFHAVHVLTEHALTCHDEQGIVSLYMVMGEREVQYPLSLTLIGHALA